MPDTKIFNHLTLPGVKSVPPVAVPKSIFLSFKIWKALACFAQEVGAQFTRKRDFLLYYVLSIFSREKRKKTIIILGRKEKDV